MKKFGQISAYVAMGLASLVGAGALFQFLAAKRDHRRFPPTGKLVDVGGFRMHIVSAGQGSPTVVLDSGSGGFSLDWKDIQVEIAKFTRVCSYDRAGHGWSEVGLRPQSIPNVTQDLHTLLQHSQVQPPYIFVSHSLGGLYSQYFARRYPQEVAGMVLIDAVHPEIYNALPAVNQIQTRRELSKRWLAAVSGLMRLGVLREPFDSASERDRARSALLMRPDFWRAGLDQNRYLKPGVERLFEEAGPFPSIPLIVLTPENVDWTASVDPGLPQVWRNCQDLLSKLSPSGRLETIPNAGHDLLTDSPERIVQTVKEIVNLVRG